MGCMKTCRHAVIPALALFGVARYCNSGVVLVTSDLHACSDALWAYPLGTVLAVADVPLTVASAGIVVVAQGAIATYRALVPAEEKQAEN